MLLHPSIPSGVTKLKMVSPPCTAPRLQTHSSYLIGSKIQVLKWYHKLERGKKTNSEIMDGSIWSTAKSVEVYLLHGSVTLVLLQACRQQFLAGSVANA